MPELPEVEVVRRQLDGALRGVTFVAGDASTSPKFAPALDALGSTVQSVGRRGKYLLIDLDGEFELVAHLGMTGSFRLVPVADPSQVASLGDHDDYTRAVWRLDDDRDLVFRDVRQFGRLRVVSTGDYALIPTLRDIGPEPLDPSFTGSALHDQLKKSKRPVKTQLLSQRPVAGVGNIYADEALFLARINPAARRVGATRSERLARAIVDVLEAGVRNGGTTFRDYVNAEGGEGNHQHQLLVYGRAGEPCVDCGTRLASRVLDGRTTTFCPECQRY